MSKTTFIFSENRQILKKGSITWKAPSNIALVKYWGKHGRQLPKNPSLSFTLSLCASKTTLEYTPKPQKADPIDFEVFFDHQSAPSFRPKITTFFERITEFVPFIRDYKFRIHTENTFPHSSGIASSASGMAALALCIMQLEAEISTSPVEKNYFYKKAGFLARLGSGSAARSVAGPLMIWGEHPAIPESSDQFALANSIDVDPVFQNYQDTILIVHKGQKKVSSSLGHDLMIGHPFADSRYDQAFVNMELLLDALQKGNLDAFVEIVEKEALTLHAIMMTAPSYFLLIKPATLAVIQHVWKYRKLNNSHLCFTLDAGANVHLLYPEKEKENVLTFIAQELKEFCQHGEYITDHLGFGPEIIL